jgi:hypothetical protein
MGAGGLSIQPPRIDAVVRFRIRTTEEGGRTQPIFGPEYRQIFRTRGHPESNWSIFVYPMRQQLELGETYELPVLFLARELVLGFLRPGTAIELCEGRRVVADGTVLSISNQAQ